ncbi:hypothetical protein CAPTEDRAFT_110564, partial [Capitella teleta]
MVTSVSALAYDCSPLSSWESTAVYNSGDRVQHNSKTYQANWWTKGNNPEQFSSAYQEWTLLGSCDGTEPPPAENKLPQVSLTSPVNGSDYIDGDSVLLRADASDEDGTISNVEFFVNNALVGSDTTAPYSLSWSAVVGTHSISARAIDDQGGSSRTSASVIDVTAVEQNQLPQVTLTSPANGAEYLPGEKVILTADASDSDGAISKVSFYAGASGKMVLLGEDNTEPYSLEW